MPTCKNCHREISVFDADVCPYCGTAHPIDENYKTKDLTGFVKTMNGPYKLYKSKSKKTAGFLCVFLGLLGAQEFYLGFWKRGLLAILGTALLVGGIGSLLYFTIPSLQAIGSYGIPLLLGFLAYAILGARYFRGDSRDARGEPLN